MAEKFKCTCCGAWFVPEKGNNSDWCPACDDEGDDHPYSSDSLGQF